jgi:hypothetical protein
MVKLFNWQNRAFSTDYRRLQKCLFKFKHSYPILHEKVQDIYQNLS